MRFGLHELIERRTDAERNVTQADGLFTGGGFLTGYFGDGEIMVIAKTEKRHFHTLFIETYTHGYAKYAIVELLRSIKICNLKYHVSKRFDFHGVPLLQK